MADPITPNAADAADAAKAADAADAVERGSAVGREGASPTPPDAPAPGDGPDMARRRFFRQFAGEIATTAATLVGTAQALQRTSAELAGAILDPMRVEESPATILAREQSAAGPVFRTAFRLDGTTLQIVDQRALPRSLVEQPAATAADVTFAIRNGVLNGGPAAGQAAAIGMALTARRIRATRPYARRATFRGAANALRNAAPANGAVASATDRSMAAYLRVGELSEDGEAIHAAMQAEADAIVAEAIADHGGLVEAGVAFLAGMPRPADGGPLRVVVHGPGGTLAGGQFGTALAVAITAHQREIPIRVVVPEGRPRFTGSRVSSWELAAGGVPHFLVADAAAPSLIASGEVDAVLVPADRVAANGDIAAAVGTYPLAVVARRHGVPVIACVPASVVDRNASDGGAFVTGYLDAAELDRFEATQLAPAGTETRVPTHDVTPAELISTWLTAEGQRTPPFVEPAPESSSESSSESAGATAAMAASGDPPPSSEEPG